MPIAFSLTFSFHNRLLNSRDSEKSISWCLKVTTIHIVPLLLVFIPTD